MQIWTGRRSKVGQNRIVYRAFTMVAVLTCVSVDSGLLQGGECCIFASQSVTGRAGESQRERVSKVLQTSPHSFCLVRFNGRPSLSYPPTDSVKL